MADPGNRWSGANPGGWAVLRRNPRAMASLVFLAIVVIASIIVPAVLDERLSQPGDHVFLRPLEQNTEGLTHLCGTDVNGLDLFYRLFSGARVSLGIGLIGALVSLLVGTFYGMIAGYTGGKVDEAMMRLVDILYSVPRILFIMIFIAALDSQFKDWLDAARLWAQREYWQWIENLTRDLLPYSRILVMVLAIGLIEWLTMARIVRGQVLVLREMTFITAARAMGQSTWQILKRHLLPNLATIILTYLTLTIPAVILTESFLSFLGLGIEDPAASWGSLLKDGAQVINPIDSKWWLLAFPAAIMSLTLLALNFLGDGLRDAFDPRSSH